MKRYFLILIIAIAAVIVGSLAFIQLVWDKDFTEISDPSFTPVPAKHVLDIATLSYGLVVETTYDNQPLIIYVLMIQKGSSLVLIPNFEENISTQRLAQANKCDVAINGGFYKEDGEPLGLFFTNRQYFGKEIQSNLVNGYFWQNEKGERFISWQLTEEADRLDFAFQSGPLIKPGETTLAIRDDEKARRSLLGIDNKGDLYLIAVVDKDNNYLGPNLSDIPKIFNEEVVKGKLNFDTILNLDGGSASFFYVREADKEFVLPELVSVGSLICVQ